jgi:hypothetical protein
MKTTLVLTLEHKKPLPADMLDRIAGRIYTQQALDQSAGSVTLQTVDEWLNQRAVKRIKQMEPEINPCVSDCCNTMAVLP